MTTPFPPHPSQVILIVMGDALIREDLRQAVTEAAPDATILLAGSIEDAAHKIAAADRVTLAFVGAAQGAFARSALADDLKRRSARVVLTESWDAAGEGQGGWQVLPFPFTSADVLAAVNPALTPGLLSD